MPGGAVAAAALAALRRARGADVLTAVTFHRVLAAGDPRWAEADPRYTVSSELFAACLEFFGRRYTPVSVDDVLAAREGGPPLPRRPRLGAIGDGRGGTGATAPPLPRRPLLVTIDDGWADTADTTLPVLRAAGCPAVVFVVGATIGAARPFWPERVTGGVLAGRLADDDLAALWAAAGGGPWPRGA